QKGLKNWFPDGMIRRLTRFFSRRSRPWGITQNWRSTGALPSAPPPTRRRCTASWRSEEAKTFAEALEAEGIPTATIYDKGVPDRHIYRHWDYVLNKWPMDEAGYPWAPQFYKGNVKYSEDMCPNTLDYLGRAVSFSLSQKFDDQDVDDFIRAVSKVAMAFYG